MFEVGIATTYEIAARSKYNRLWGQLTDQFKNESRLPHCCRTDKGNSSTVPTFPEQQRGNYIGHRGSGIIWVLEST